MTQLEAFKYFIAAHGYRVTLGEMLRSSHAAEYRKMATFLRREGWIVTVKINRLAPGENLYTFTAPVLAAVDNDKAVPA